MQAAPKPINEAARLRSLSEYRILGTKPEKAFDNITRMASEICQSPIALISLVDEKRQWFKSKVGLEASETDRDISFCAHTILDSKPLVVEDALFHEKFRDNPLVQEEPHIRLYAGFPLKTDINHRIGTLCVIDRIPKSLTNSQYKVMEGLAEQATTLLELRRRSLALMDEFCQMHHAQGLITTCSYCKSTRDSEGFWQPIERFLMQHSTLNFSHGICPECMNEHFPDVQNSRVESLNDQS